MPRVGMLILVLLLCGCGLEEYEEKMRLSAKRLKLFEEQGQVLGGQIQAPFELIKEKGQPTSFPPLFVRLPKELKSQPEKEPRNKLLYLYSRITPPAPVPGRGQPAPVPVATGPFLEAMLAFGTLEWNVKQFALHVAQNCLVGDGPEKYPAPVLHKVVRLDGSELVVQRMVFEAGGRGCSVNVWSGKKVLVAVVYVWEKAKQGQAVKPEQMSLSTFAAEEDAAKASLDFVMGGPLGPPPTFVPAAEE